MSATIQTFSPIDLDTLDRCARLRTRKDRKYVVTAAELAELLDTAREVCRSELCALEIDGQRWFSYRSIYFDTERFDSYRLAATHRPHRFKVRTRSYLDLGRTVAEVKTKSRRGRTVKHRRRLDPAVAHDDSVREFASEFCETAPYAAALRPVLTSRYRRATLAFPHDGVRVTIDAAYRCVDEHGASTGLDDEFIVETKTGGAPCDIDRLLWTSGHRPDKVSKYATGLAALHPELPANRWHPVLSTHFGRATGAPDRRHLGGVPR